MGNERRRYFRITDEVGITYRILDSGNDNTCQEAAPASDILDVVADQDRLIEKLLSELQDEHPKLVELIEVFNQKIERVVNQLVMESQLINKIAHRVKQANISACGIAFSNTEKINENARLTIELCLYPDETRISTFGKIVSCAQDSNDAHTFYWRVDFYGMRSQDQEKLIQHIVRSQSSQLKLRRT